MNDPVPIELETLGWLGWVLAMLVTAVASEFAALILSFRQLLRVTRETTGAALSVSQAVRELQALLRDIKAAEDTDNERRFRVLEEALGSIRQACASGFSELRRDLRNPPGTGS